MVVWYMFLFIFKWPICCSWLICIFHCSVLYIVLYINMHIFMRFWQVVSHCYVLTCTIVPKTVMDVNKVEVEVHKRVIIWHITNFAYMTSNRRIYTCYRHTCTLRGPYNNNLSNDTEDSSFLIWWCLFKNVPVEEVLQIIWNRLNTNSSFPECSPLQVKDIMASLDIC
jgi:hypothetical protein